jgi:CheY-like chemotaxis protein
MGISSHRASSGREATQLIQSVRIHVAVVDLGLPLNTPTAQHEPELDSIEPADLAEGGPRLLELLTRLEARPPVVAVKRTRTQRDETRDIAQSLRLGAFAVVDRPRDTEGLNVMLGVLKRCLERHYAGRWPGMG